MTCFKCDLSIGRKNVVLGIGNKKASIMIIGEAPGYNEDKTGIPFVGKSGTYLRGLLNNVGINESNSYITNVVKCRPHNNRTLNTNEISMCTSLFLAKEVEFVNPIIIICAGKTSSTLITGQNINMYDNIGKTFKIGKRWVIPIYHPSYILQNEHLKDEYSKLINHVSIAIHHIQDNFLFDLISDFGKDIEL